METATLLDIHYYNNFKLHNYPIITCLMIEVKSISKRFEESEVLSEINAHFQKGKTNLIIGQSGSGKTVFLKNIIVSCLMYYGSF